MLWLFLGAISISFAPIFVKAIDLGPTFIGALRTGLASLFLIPVFYLVKKPAASTASPIPSSFWKYLLAAALLFAGDLYVWHRSVIYAGAGISTILGNTQVFYLSVLGILFLGEKLTLRFAIAVPMAFLGVFLLISYQGDLASLPRFHEGVAYGVFTGMFYAGYISCLRKAESLTQNFSAAQKLSMLCALCAVILLGISYLDAELKMPTPIDWVWLCLLAITAQAIGWVLISTNLPKVPISRAGLILLTQPTLAAVWGVLIYGETLSVIQVVGGALTLSGIYLGSTAKSS